MFIVLPFAAPAQIISNVAGNGTVGYSGNGGDATVARLDSPTCVALDGSGNVYINDQLNHSIRKVDPAGVITTLAGTGSFGYGGDGGPASAARLNGNWGVAADAAGNVYITDQYNYRVRRVGTSGTITTIAGTGANGYSGDGGPAVSATFRKPLGIAVDDEGNVYVGDADNYRIRRISVAGNITTYAGTGTSGNSGDEGPATDARLGYVWGLATGKDGSLYICDGTYHKIRKVTPDGIIHTFAGTGTAGISGDNGPATAARFNLPVGVSVLPNGTVVVTDCRNDRIRKIGTDGIVRTIGGTGVAGYNGDGIPATAARLHSPVGIATDASENIYFADMGNVRVRKIANVLYFIKGDDTVLDVCQNSIPVSINHLLAVRDIYVGLTDVWTLQTAPAHGTAVVGHSATSTGGITTPAGITYTPDAGYNGTDSFEIKVANSITSDVIKIYVNVAPLLSPGTIEGPDMVCLGETVWLSNPTAGGGVWSVVGSKLSVAVAGGICVVRGEGEGVDTVRYQVTNACGVATTTKAITVNPLPDAGTLTGPAAFCKGSTVAFIASVPGGIWSTSNPNTEVNVLGQVKGLQGGPSTVIYTVSNAWCQAAAIKMVVVEVFPEAGVIEGPMGVCLHSEVLLKDTIEGGVWSSTLGNVSVSNGKVRGLAVGNDFVNYSITNTCGTDVASLPIMVYPVPAEPDVTVIQGVLYATKGYPSYQWRINTTDIPGATADTFYAQETGIYEVVVKNTSGCSAVSAKLNYTGCDPGDMEVMPNPVTGELTVVWCKKVTAILLTIDGRYVGQADEVRKIIFRDIPSGTYILNVYDNEMEKVRSVKIVKL
ncbi:hypothetical protein GCM10023093_04750 [Nemorincola caseinilytica]|uniref:Teneurin NHL domain-containing protein n=1 Tax=Nemorincola caseinilytica TaxID=2054315 RepID=A0ABP8N7X0_9BACT